MIPPCGHADQTTHAIKGSGPWDRLPNGDPQCAVCWHVLNAPGYREYYAANECSLTPPPPAGEMDKPGLIQRTVNYRSTRDEWIANGSKLVSDTVYQERGRQCRGDPAAGLTVCPMYRTSDDTCAGCGCPLHPTLFGDKMRMDAITLPPGCRWPLIVVGD